MKFPENLPGGAFYWQDGSVLALNEILLSWLGNPTMNKAYAQLAGVLDRDFLDFNYASLSPGEVWQAETFLTAGEGNHFPVFISVRKPLEDSSEKRLYLVQKAQAWVRARAEWQRLAGITAHNPFFIVEINARGHPTYQNTTLQSFCQRHKFSLTEVLPDDLFLLLAQNESQTSRAKLGESHRSLCGHRVLRWEMYGAGKRHRYLLFGQDYTREAKFEETLAENGEWRLKAEILGKLKHEFNNLLGAISANTELAELQTPPDSEVASFLQKVLQTVDRGRDLVLETSRWFSENPETKDSPRVSIERLIEDLGKAVELASGKGCFVRRELQDKLPDMPLTLADAQKVFLPVLMNSVKAMPQGGTITFTGFTRKKANSNYLVFQITDRGEGIPHHLEEQIWEPFFTNWPKGQVQGPGLFSARRILEKYHGTIRLIENNGETTVFEITILLPAGKETVSSTPRKSLQVSLSGRTILVVEDEPDVRNLYQQTLMSEGCRVLLFPSAVEVPLAEVVSMTPDLLLTDLRVPGGGVEELACNLRRSLPMIPIIVGSGFINQQTEAFWHRLGSTTLLPKPFSRRELLLVLRQILSP
ncbi:MAG: response regulator [Opitutales bacterium]|nr:response regulator [Opitutales bacterium]